MCSTTSANAALDAACTQQDVFLNNDCLEAKACPVQMNVEVATLLMQQIDVSGGHRRRTTVVGPEEGQGINQQGHQLEDTGSTAQRQSKRNWKK